MISVSVVNPPLSRAQPRTVIVSPVSSKKKQKYRRVMVNCGQKKHDTMKYKWFIGFIEFANMYIYSNQFEGDWLTYRYFVIVLLHPFCNMFVNINVCEYAEMIYYTENDDVWTFYQYILTI